MDKELLRKLERGREHYESNEYDRAEPFLLQVAEQAPTFADVMNMLGVIYHDRGQVALAQEYFEKALRINARYTEAALNLAVTYNEQGMYEEAKKVHEHATSLQPSEKKQIEPFARGKLANMHADLGRAYAELQIVDKAVQQYREALKIAPEFVDIRTRLGQVLKDAGQHDAAIREFSKVKVDRPKYVPARVSLGATHFAMGDKAAARKEWMEVLEIDPENRTAGMYLRMVEQMIAQDEADAAGMHLEVEEPRPAPEAADRPEEELSFSIDGERASMTGAETARGGDAEEGESEEGESEEGESES